MLLQDKLLLVIGGGAGIGAGICLEAAENGARVVVADINADTAQQTLETLPHRERHLTVTVDVSKSEAVEAMLDTIRGHYGELPSLLAHSAAIFRNYKGILGCPEAVFDELMSVNMKGVYLVNRAMVLAWKTTGVPGVIVNISSRATCGFWMAPAYSATKGAINSWSKALAKEMGSHGIRINVIAPGVVDTDIGFGALEDPNDPEQRRVQKESQWKAPVPLGRLGKAKDVAQLAVFLLSDKSSYITASVFDINGGATDDPAP